MLQPHCTQPQRLPEHQPMLLKKSSPNWRQVIAVATLARLAGLAPTEMVSGLLHCAERKLAIRAERKLAIPAERKLKMRHCAHLPVAE
jgi:hypothetical protein